MSHRPGMTLLEVMVAIFIMSIGMLALLTLFPIGLLSMSKAIQDDRANSIALQAAALANTWDVRGTLSVISVPAVPSTSPPCLSVVFPTFWGPPANYNLNPSITTDLEGNYNGPALPGGNNWVSPFPVQPLFNAPSYALYVDPIGYIINGGTPGAASPGVKMNMGVATGQTPGLLRETVPYVGGPGDAARWFSCLDDITFTGADLPPAAGLGYGLAAQQPSSTSLVNRLGYYSWAYLLKRTQSAIFSPAPPQLSVVVYSGRSIVPGGETVYASSYVNTNTLNVAANAGPPLDQPALRRNSWILDITFDPTNLVHADFYRVVSVNDLPVPGSLPTTQIEVTPPLKYTTVSFVMVMENVIGVFPEN